MHIKLIAIGKQMPAWVNEGVRTYTSRLPPHWKLDLIEVASKKRLKTTDLVKLLQEEGEQLLNLVAPQDQIILLDRIGQAIDTTTMAKQLQHCQDQAQNISLLVGGPEGLPKICFDKAHQVWSLSKLTYPHPLVRIILVEQIYRAWSILSHHPYHR